MEKIEVHLGKKKVVLGEKVEDIERIRRIATSIELDTDGRLMLLEIPIAAYSYILYKDVKYKTINELMINNDLKYTNVVICCGEGEGMELVDISDVDYGSCPFNSLSEEDCLLTCHNTLIYRGNNTLGFDMAQPRYPESECILIAMPNHAYKVKE